MYIKLCHVLTPYCLYFEFYVAIVVGWKFI